jgi:hypothetical protein
MTGFFERAPIIGRHSTAVLLTNHTKPTLNTRFVKNNTFFFAIFHAFVSSNAVPTGPIETALSRSNLGSGAIKLASPTGQQKRLGTRHRTSKKVA